MTEYTDCDTCFKCGGECCKTVAIRLDTPEDLDDFEDFKWYLYHPHFTVFQDTEKDWNAEISIQCRHLGKDARCAIYDKRPPVCRGYDVKTCNDGDGTIIIFEKPEDVDKYVEELKAKGRFTKDGKLKQNKKI